MTFTKEPILSFLDELISNSKDTINAKEELIYTTWKKLCSSRTDPLYQLALIDIETLVKNIAHELEKQSLLNILKTHIERLE
jgi:hypothetical protein